MNIEKLVDDLNQVYLELQGGETETAGDLLAFIIQELCIKPVNENEDTEI